MPEESFANTKGVLSTVVGYCGGTTTSPTYEAIGDHTEALRVEFDPKILGLEEMIRMFWSEHTPYPATIAGTQYRSAIFYHDAGQLAVANHVRTSLRPPESPFSSALDLTALEPAGDFYRAEEYHQRWIAKQRGAFASGRIA